jgi:hypothetical protein
VPAGPDRHSGVAGAQRREPDSPVPFWALMAFTFILFLAPQNMFPALEPFRIALLAGGVAIATHLADRFLRRRRVALSREMWAIAGLVGWAILMIPLSYWPGGSLRFLLGVYLKPLAIFWLLANVVNTVPRLRRVAWALTMMAGPVALTAIDSYLSGDFVPGAIDRIVSYEAPLTSNANDLALTLSLILPLTIALLLITRKAVLRGLLLAAIVLDVGAVVVSFSRAGFLAVVTALVLYARRLLRRQGQAWIVVTLLFVVLVSLPLIPQSYVDRLATIINVKSDPSGSAQTRWNDMALSVWWVLRNPIVGAGLGQNIVVLNAERGPLWLSVHNVYLEYAVELGIPGLVLFLVLLGTCLQNARAVQRRAAGVPARRDVFYLAEGIWTSLIVFTLAAFFYPVAYQFHFYYIAGMAAALRTIDDAEGAHGVN